MTRWFCAEHAAAGLAVDRVCCSAAQLCVCRVACRCGWLRLRCEAKGRDWTYDVVMLRHDGVRMIEAIQREASRKGGRFVMGRGAE